MAEVLPFRGLRYDERAAGPLASLVAPPYDVISPERRAALLGRSARNFVRVELPEPTPAGHAAAGDLLLAWQRDGALRAEAEPAVYLDEHRFRLGTETVVRTELLAALRLYEPSAGVVLPHERTFPKAKAERLELLRATRANTSPVFGMFADDDGALARLRAAPASAHAAAEADGEGHRLRVVTDRAAIDALRRALADARVYIADGHHRYETALTYANERAARDADPERFVLAALCALDDPGLRILATHRLVRDGDAALDRAVAASCDAVPLEAGAGGWAAAVSAALAQGSGIVFARGDRFVRLGPKSDADLSSLPPAWRALPVALAEELLLKPAHTAGAQITYEHDTEAALAASRDGASAVFLRAVDPATLRAVADAGERLPQKTTYFHPKVPAGLVIRSLDVG